MMTPLVMSLVTLAQTFMIHTLNIAQGTSTPKTSLLPENAASAEEVTLNSHQGVISLA